MKRLYMAASCLLVATGIACTDGASAPTGPVRPPVDTGILVPTLRSSVDASGRFKLPGAPADEINEATARAFADAYIRYILPHIIGDWIEDRRAPIDHRKLQVCEHVYYAASPYEPLGDDVELPVRMVFSPRWLVGACTPDGIQVGSIGIASRATHLVVEDGRFTAGDQSNVFRSSGVPTGIPSVPLTPERAVAGVVGRLGKRAAVVPELVLPDPFEGAAQHAKWRTGIEAPVALRLDGADESVTTATVYYGLGPSMGTEVMVVDQPPASGGRVFRYHTPEGQMREITLKTKPGYATGYRAVREGGN